MTAEQILMIILGSLLILLGGVSDVLLKGRRGQRTVQLIGKAGTKILYTIIGIALILVAVFYIA